MIALQDEIENLKDEIASRQRDYDALCDERDRQLSDCESRYETKISELDSSWQDRFEELEKESKQQVDTLTKELTKLRNAFSEGKKCPKFSLLQMQCFE
eukprot:gene35922-46636_t